MLNPLQSESLRALFFFCAYLLVALLSGYWLFAALIVLACYALTLFYDNYKIVKWLKKGANMSQYPQVNGLSETVATNILQLRKRGKQRNKRLKAILDRFYSMAVGLPDAVVVLEEDCSIEWSNEQAVELLGINHERDKGQRIDNLIRDPEFHHYLMQADLEEPIRLASPLGTSAVLNIRLVRFRDGAQLLLARDLSNVVRAEQIRRSFVSNVSHEMRTPLTVINGYTEMLLGDEKLDQETSNALAAIANQASRLQNIIDGLLELSRLQDKPLSKNTEAVPMASLIREIVSEVHHSTHSKTHTLQTDLDDDIYLNGSPILMQSVISNLVYNAIHHTDAGTEIDIYWGESGDGGIELAVSDTGHGIASEHLSRLTERFYRVDESRKRQKSDEFGAGLGLAIVKHIVEAHQGELVISSRLEFGTTFRCKFHGTKAVALDK